MWKKRGVVIPEQVRVGVILAKIVPGSLNQTSEKNLTILKKIKNYVLRNELDRLYIGGIIIPVK
jgi:hypothetical protein